MLWEHALALVQNVAAETHQNLRVQVCTGVVVDLLLLRCNLLPNDNRTNTFWKALLTRLY